MRGIAWYSKAQHSFTTVTRQHTAPAAVLGKQLLPPAKGNPADLPGMLQVVILHQMENCGCGAECELPGQPVTAGRWQWAGLKGEQGCFPNS